MLRYDEAIDAVHGGRMVFIAFGTTAQGPCAAWMELRLDAEAQAWAYHPHKPVRAAHAIGVVREVRKVARRAGFTPA